MVSRHVARALRIERSLMIPPSARGEPPLARACAASIMKARAPWRLPSLRLSRAASHSGWSALGNMRHPRLGAASSRPVMHRQGATRPAVVGGGEDLRERPKTARCVVRDGAADGPRRRVRRRVARVTRLACACRARGRSRGARWRCRRRSRGARRCPPRSSPLPPARSGTTAAARRSRSRVPAPRSRRGG